jgi:DNA-directed RNA polymerase II subunit RPB1
MRRKFTEEEITDVLSFIKTSPNIPLEISEANIERIKLGLKSQIYKCDIIPEVIPTFKKELENAYYKALIEAGEMVGILAGTYLAEIVTQLTLNAFHFAGISTFSIALGVPRLQELLNCTKIIKQPSMTLFFKKEIEDKMNILKKNKYNIDYNELQKIEDKKIKEIKELELKSKNELLEEEYKIFKEIEEITLFELLDKNFLINGHEKVNEFKLQKPVISYNRILTDIEEQWYDVYYELYDDVVREAEYSWSIRLVFNKDKLYEKNITLLEVSKKIEIFRDLYCVVSPDNIGIIDVYVDCEKIDIPQDKEWINDDNKSLIFIETVVIDYLMDLLVKGVDGIKNIYFKKEDNKWINETDGSNLQEIFNYDYFDHTKVLTNDIWEVYRVFGIEATRNVLLIEFKKIIANSFIFNCHIDNLCDAMTHTGKITSVSRYGIDKDEAGPLTTASFEEPFKCLLNAGVNQKIEEIEGVSSCVITGQFSKIGTGAFDILYNTNLNENENENKTYNLMNSLNPNIKSKTKELKTEIIKEIKEIKKEEIKKEEIKNNDLELDFSSSDDDLSPKKSRSPSPSPIFKKKLIIKKQKKSIKKEKGKSYSLDETIGDDVMEIY